MVIAHRRDWTGWWGMPSEPIGADEQPERGAWCPIGLAVGPGMAVIEREPPLRVGNQRQERTERLSIGGTNGIMRCRS